MKNKILKELKGNLRGELLWDPLILTVYSTGADIYRAIPMAVAFPKDKQDVVEILKLCKTCGVPLIPRGTGSSVAGQVLGRGIIVDFSRYLNRIKEINLDEQWVDVEPGVVLTELNSRLNEYGYFFPPDPASQDQCTLGGMIGNNSSGSHTIKYGSTKDYIIGLKILLASGEKINLTKDSNDLPDSLKKVKEFLFSYKEEILEKIPQVVKNSSGYNLVETVKENGNLLKLIVGSEGTLGIVLEARLKIIPLPSFFTASWLWLSKWEDVVEAVELLRTLSPSALEFLDKNVLKLLEPNTSDFALLLEFSGEKEKEVKQSICEATQLLKKKKLIKDYQLALTSKERDQIWQLRKEILPLTYRAKIGERRPVSFIEDIVVPPSKFTSYILKIQEYLKSKEVDFLLYGHAGDGNVHLKPLLNLQNEKELLLMEEIKNYVNKLVIDFEGSFSGEHGDGILRAKELPLLFPKTYPLMAKIKQILDPQNILNPGKKVTLEEWELKVSPQFRWEKALSIKDDIIKDEIFRCIGCGMCRSFCPVYQITRREELTPRGRVNWLREFLGGKAKSLSSSYIDKEFLDLCLSCHTCSLNCPSQVEGGLVTTIIRNFVSEKPIVLEPLDLFLSYFPLLLKYLSPIAPLYNFLSSILPPKLFNTVTGIAPQREVPKIQSFKDINVNLKSSKNKEVIIFAGCWEKYISPESQLKPMLKLLEANGYGYLIPPVECCGLPLLTGGFKSDFIKIAQKNLKLLYPYAKAGQTILFSCPSCALALKGEYVSFLPENEFASIVAKQVKPVTQFVIEKDLSLPHITPKKIGYHLPCHLKVVSEAETTKQFIEKTGLKLVAENKGCCGMAGSFGWKKRHINLSEEIAKKNLSPFIDADLDGVLSECPLCRQQIKETLGCKVWHPLELLFL